MNKICGYPCEHSKGGICQITYCNKIGKLTTTATNDNCGITIYKGNVDTTTGKIILNGVEITDTESWHEAINTFSRLENEIEEKDKEIERLNNTIDEIEKGLNGFNIKGLIETNNREVAMVIDVLKERLKELKESK